VLDLFAYTGLVALWPSAFGPGQGSAAQFKSNFHNPPSWSSTTPFWNADGDPAFINIGLHALYGSEAYLAFRSRRHGVPASFAFAVVQTFVWEYFIEGPFHAPSLIDLVWTPFAGAVLGELRLQLLLLIERRMRPGALKSALMFVLDPLGTVERAACHCRLSSD
jgi:hypothetical protein